MLEREQDLARCLATLPEVANGHGRFLVIEGPAGIGKTALMRAFLEADPTRALNVLTARGTELERELPFGAIRQLLDPVVSGSERSDGLFVGAAAITRQLFEPEQPRPVPGDPFAMLHGLYWLISALAERKPLVLAIDDAHWLDQPSLRFLSFLQPRLGELSVLASLATRPIQDEPGDDALGRIAADPETRLVQLQPLSREAVASLVNEWLGETDVATTDACVTVTGGNPFYLVELLRELESNRSKTSEGTRPQAVGPRSIAKALRFRGQASAAGLAFARALAVLGDGSRFQDVAQLANLDHESAKRAADAMVTDAVLSSGPHLAFAHPIVRTAVYEDIGAQERAAMHKRAARLTRATAGDVNRTAVHLLSAEPVGDGWAVEILRDAASSARRNGAPEVAIRYLRRAIGEPPDAARRSQVLMELALAMEAAGEPGTGPLFFEAHASLTDPASRARTALAAALAFSSAGEPSRSVDMLDAAASELSRLPRDAALELEARITIMAFFQTETASVYPARLDRLSEDELAGGSLGERLMLCVMGARLMWRGRDAERAARLVERGYSIELLEHLGPESLEMNATGVTLAIADRHEAANRVIDDMTATSRKSGSRFGYGVTSMLRAALGNRRGDLVDAESAARAAMGVSFDSRQSVLASVGCAELVAALTERGDFGQADLALEPFGLVTGAAPPDAMYTSILSSRGRLRLARGQPDAALMDLFECGRRRELIGGGNPLFMPWRGEAALAHRALGDVDAAVELADEHMEEAQRWGTMSAVGSAQRIRGLLAEDPSESIGRLRAAVDCLALSPARLDHGKALVDLGSTLRRAGHRADARTPLMHGLDIADRCGAVPLSRRARMELAAIGVRPRHARLTGVEALTASEHRVAQMAAEGMSNVEIAQTLFVTRKTVEKHLGNAYGKLGVSSRTSLRHYLGARENA